MQCSSTRIVLTRYAAKESQEHDISGEGNTNIMLRYSLHGRPGRCGVDRISSRGMQAATRNPASSFSRFESPAPA